MILNKEKKKWWVIDLQANKREWQVPHIKLVPEVNITFMSIFNNNYVGCMYNIRIFKQILVCVVCESYFSIIIIIIKHTLMHTYF